MGASGASARRISPGERVVLVGDEDAAVVLVDHEHVVAGVAQGSRRVADSLADVEDGGQEGDLGHGSRLRSPRSVRRCGGDHTG
jgi:hypothetical protein